MNQTVGQVLSANDISTDGYTVDVDLDASVRDVSDITLKANTKGTVSVDGQTIDYDQADKTVGDLLQTLGVQVGADDVVTPSADTALTTDVTAITVDRVEYKEEQRQEEIGFETTETEDSSIDSGTTTVDTQGVNGVKTITEKVKYMNGVRIDALTESEEVTTEPVTQVQRKGTKAAASSDTSSSSTAAASSDSGSSGTYTGTAVSVSSSDFDMICAIVAHEGGTSYKGAAAVMSAVMNRYDAGYASSPLGVLTAAGQFSSYLDGYYTMYLGGGYGSAVEQAVTDCLNGYRMHSYKNFHAGYGSGEYIVNQTFY